MVRIDLRALVRVQDFVVDRGRPEADVVHVSSNASGEHACDVCCEVPATTNLPIAPAPSCSRRWAHRTSRWTSIPRARRLSRNTPRSAARAGLSSPRAPPRSPRRASIRLERGQSWTTERPCTTPSRWRKTRWSVPRAGHPGNSRRDPARNPWCCTSWPSATPRDRGTR